jgi:hypothetical protein
MSVIGEGAVSSVCVNHPRRETVLRCGKCGDFICTRCMVTTPVGVRCRSCAQLRRLPQFDVGPLLLARSGLAGLAVSIVCWVLISGAPFLRYFLAILVGAAVGETMSRLAQRRVSRSLEVVAVGDILAGLLLIEFVRTGSVIGAPLSAVGNNPSLFLWLVVPALIASFVAVVKLR